MEQNQEILGVVELVEISLFCGEIAMSKSYAVGQIILYIIIWLKYIIISIETDLKGLSKVGLFFVEKVEKRLEIVV